MWGYDTSRTPIYGGKIEGLKSTGYCRRYGAIWLCFPTDIGWILWWRHIRMFALKTEGGGWKLGYPRLEIRLEIEGYPRLEIEACGGGWGQGEPGGGLGIMAIFMINSFRRIK